MKVGVAIWNHDYQVYKRFHPLVLHLSTYLVKIVGVDYVIKKEKVKKIREGKKLGKSMKTSVFYHLLRKTKKKTKKKAKHKKDKYETTKSL